MLGVINAADLSLFDSPEDVHEFAGSIYNRAVNAQHECTDLYISKHKKGYYKFSWHQELDLLKEKAISSNKVWKAAGSLIRGLSFSNVNQTNWLQKKSRRQRKMSCSAIKIVDTTHYQMV